MNSPIKPLDGWVIIKPIPIEEEKTKGGIILANNLSATEIDRRKNKGLVIETPKDSPVSKGCTVYYKAYAGIDCFVPGESEKYLAIEFQDLCGVLKESE